MKILLISDTHGNNVVIDKLVEMYPNMDKYLHAGDVEGDEYSLAPFDAVKGNCDHYSTLPIQRIISTPYGNLFMTHEPHMPINIKKEYDIKIFIHGHTHRRKFVQENGLYIINPGSISFSRDGYELSYAILTITENDVQVEFKTLLD